MHRTDPSRHPCELASARWRLHARAAVLRDLRSRQRINPQRWAAEMARLRAGLTLATTAAAESMPVETALPRQQLTQRRVQSREFPDSSLEPPVTSPRDEVTRILQQMDRRSDAAEELLPLVYEQLRAIAQRRMREERAGHTLQATALVHEAFAKLVGGNGGGDQPGWESRGHFFRVAAEAMRRILIDHARKRKSVKRGGGARPIPLSVVDLATEHDPSQILALNEALETLEAEDARAAEVVKLRFFAGLSVEETAETMGISERTAMREWAFARARLYELLAVEE